MQRLKEICSPTEAWGPYLETHRGERYKRDINSYSLPQLWGVCVCVRVCAVRQTDRWTERERERLCVWKLSGTRQTFLFYSCIWGFCWSALRDTWQVLLSITSYLFLLLSSWRWWWWWYVIFNALIKVRFYCSLVAVQFILYIVFVYFLFYICAACV